MMEQEFYFVHMGGKWMPAKGRVTQTPGGHIFLDYGTNTGYNIEKSGAVLVPISETSYNLAIATSGSMMTKVKSKGRKALDTIASMAGYHRDEDKGLGE